MKVRSQMDLRKRLATQLLFGALIAIVVVAILPSRCSAQQARRASPGVDLSSFWGPTSIDGPPIGVTVDDLHFRLARRNVFSATSTGFVLLAHWPDMGGDTAETADEFVRPATGNVIMVLMESSLRPGAEGSRSDQHSPSSAAAFLNGAVERRRQSRTGPSVEVETSFGLREFRAVGARPGYSDNIDRADYFTSVEGAAAGPHIFCNSDLGRYPGREWVPICQDLTLYRAIEIKISFDRRLLPEWREIEAKTRMLLDSFEAVAQ